MSKRRRLDSIPWPDGAKNEPSHPPHPRPNRGLLRAVQGGRTTVGRDRRRIHRLGRGAPPQPQGPVAPRPGTLRVRGARDHRRHRGGVGLGKSLSLFRPSFRFPFRPALHRQYSDRQTAGGRNRARALPGLRRYPAAGPSRLCSAFSDVGHLRRPSRHRPRLHALDSLGGRVRRLEPPRQLAGERRPAGAERLADRA